MRWTEPDLEAVFLQADGQGAAGLAGPVRTAFVIAGKDLRQRLRDRSAFLVAFVVPFVLAAIFGLTLHDVGSGHVTFSLRARRPGPRMRPRAPSSTDVLAPIQKLQPLAQGAGPELEPRRCGRDDADNGKVAASRS